MYKKCDTHVAIDVQALESVVSGSRVKRKLMKMCCPFRFIKLSENGAS